MSMRPRQAKTQTTPTYVQPANKPSFYERAHAVESGNAPVTASEALRFEDLTPVEQAAASLGVEPFAYKPIKV